MSKIVNGNEVISVDKRIRKGTCIRVKNGLDTYVVLGVSKKRLVNSTHVVYYTMIKKEQFGTQIEKTDIVEDEFCGRNLESVEDVYSKDEVENYTLKLRLLGVLDEELIDYEEVENYISTLRFNKCYTMDVFQGLTCILVNVGFLLWLVLPFKDVNAVMLLFTGGLSLMLAFNVAAFFKVIFPHRFSYSPLN